MTPINRARVGRLTAVCVIVLMASAVVPARAQQAVPLTPVVRGTPAGDGAEVVVLCPDIAVRPEVFISRGRGGLGHKLAQSGYRVYLVDPWNTSAASDDGFDGVVSDVWPIIAEKVKQISKGAPVTFIGHGLCGLLPIAAAAAPRGTAVPMRWVSMGTRYDWRIASPAWTDWLAAWARDERPLPPVTKRTLLTGLRAPLGGRASSVPPTLPQDEDMGEVMYRFYEKSIYREPPKAVIADVQRWFASGAMTSRQGWIDYSKGFDEVSGPALVLSGMSDPVAPPEDALYALERLGDRGRYRLLSRASGHNEEYGHLGMLLSRHSAWDVDRVILAWLRGWEKLP
jgi:hypothetical protein